MTTLGWFPMAHYTSQNTAFGPISNPIGSFFAGLGNALVLMSTANARVRQVERLQKLSNDQLAERGIRRENIARHVFRDLYWG